ncbi:MAG: phage holin family protein [Atopobiaceae bacterium]|nr:phage holin family protein [Atopobiaceae bacterium]
MEQGRKRHANRLRDDDANRHPERGDAKGHGCLALALVNAIIAPVAQFFSLPITVLTLGIFYLVVNAFMLQLASGLSVAAVGSGIEINSFGSAFVGSIIISIASMVIHGVLAG